MIFILIFEWIFSSISEIKMKAYTFALFLMVAILFVLTNYAESKMLMGKGGGNVNIWNRRINWNRILYPWFEWKSWLNVDVFSSSGWRSRSRGRRPWDRNRSAERIWGRRPTGERYRQLEEMEQDGIPRRRQQYGRNYQDEGECYWNQMKLKRICSL